MRRIAALILLLASSLALPLSAHARRENTSIGENGREARKAAKQQRKRNTKIHLSLTLPRKIRLILSR